MRSMRHYTPDVYRRRIAYLERALRKIEKKKDGRFSWEHLSHAVTTINDMAQVATDALAGTWEDTE